MSQNFIKLGLSKALFASDRKSIYLNRLMMKDMFKGILVRTSIVLVAVLILTFFSRPAFGQV